MTREEFNKQHREAIEDLKKSLLEAMTPIVLNKWVQVACCVGMISVLVYIALTELP